MSGTPSIVGDNVENRAACVVFHAHNILEECLRIHRNGNIVKHVQVCDQFIVSVEAKSSVHFRD